MSKLNNRVAFHTVGCKVNQYETDALVEQFKNNDYKIVAFEEVADIYIINTCTVTNLSSRKSRKMLRRAKKANPEAIVVAMGCYPQEAPEKLEEMPAVDIIIGNQNKQAVLQYIKSYTGDTENYVDDIMQYETFENFVIHDTLDKTRAFIKIQDGCDQYCSYCIIPYVRGKVRSKKYETILDEINGLVDNGFKEIVLTGIHVTKYGNDLEDAVDLIDLLEDINKINGLKRIRLSSLEPTFLTIEKVKRLGQIDKLCPHFHLSLQSGSDSVLYRMNRDYTTKDYAAVVANLRKFFNNPAITTDIIVGFPGETDLEFKETCEFVDQIKFSQIHVFKYSKRDKTVASQMDHQIDGNISAERSKILRNKVEKLQEIYDRSFVGTTQKVLFESYDPDQKIAEGLTENYVRVKVYSDRDITSEIYSVKLQEYDNIVIGKIIEEV